MSTETLLPTLARIAAIIGLDATLKLVEEYGGGNHYLPVRPRGDHPWAELAGAEAFAKLCAEFGGKTLEIPTQAYAHVRKKELVLELADAGLTPREIARRARCTRRYAYRVLQGLPRQVGSK